MVTASLTIDYAGAAKLGDWVEIHTDVQKVGKSLAFANCYFSVKEKRIARASGVFGVAKV
jgi:acyl-coenzyme A thioesterase PaaI-like protein